MTTVQKFQSGAEEMQTAIFSDLDKFKAAYVSIVEAMPKELYKEFMQQTQKEKDALVKAVINNMILTAGLDNAFPNS